jgi:hypothetical protein
MLDIRERDTMPGAGGTGYKERVIVSLIPLPISSTSFIFFYFGFSASLNRIAGLLRVCVRFCFWWLCFGGGSLASEMLSVNRSM